MHSYRRDSCINEQACYARGVDRIGIPANANLGRHRHWRDRSNYRGRDTGQSRTIFQQCGAAISGDYFVDRTTEVQINEIWTHPINDLARRFRHVLAVGTEELHTDWPFDLIKIQVLTRPRIAAENSFGRNEFGRENVSAIFFAELPENLSDTPAIGAR